MAKDQTSPRVPLEEQREEVGETTDLAPILDPLVTLDSFCYAPSSSLHLWRGRLEGSKEPGAAMVEGKQMT
jgi:hypothetical protein